MHNYMSLVSKITNSVIGLQHVHVRVGAGNNLHAWLNIQGLPIARILNKRHSTNLLIKFANHIKMCLSCSSLKTCVK